jgi:hypothetical protein
MFRKASARPYSEITWFSNAEFWANPTRIPAEMLGIKLIDLEGFSERVQTISSILASSLASSHIRIGIKTRAGAFTNLLCSEQGGFANSKIRLTFSGQISGAKPASQSVRGCKMTIKLAIEELIDRRSRELGLRPIDLIRRTTCRNEAKGLRRLSALRSGDLASCKDLIVSLPQALDVPIETVEAVISENKRQLIELDEQRRAGEEAAWRASFRPHAIILTDRTVPQPIFVAALVGVNRILRIDFDDIAKPTSFVDQALAGVRHRIEEFGGDAKSGRSQLPAFGRPVGLVVNYTPDAAIRYDLQGLVQETFLKAHRLPEAQFSFR